MNPDQSLLIAFITDDRISHEKLAVLTQKLNLVAQNFSVEVIKGPEITEGQLLERLKQKKFHLTLLPLHRYQAWNRIDAELGPNRTSGPTVAGYFCESIPLFHAQPSTSTHGQIILDFFHSTPQEILILIRSLVQDTQRSGLKPLLESKNAIYCESWYGNQGQGNRTDFILGLPEIMKSNWIKRSSSIRILLSALWGLIYEEGPGKTELTQAVPGGTTTRAYFQFGISDHCLAFRLYFYTVPHTTPKELLHRFWPDKTLPSRPAQLLIKYADFLRIHTIKETSDIEVVAVLFPSAAAENSPEQAHTLWIEPLSARLIQEPPYEAPGPNAPHLRALPIVSLNNPKPRLVDSAATEIGPRKSDRRSLQEATQQIKELKQTIQELKSGGIGTAQPLPPPDAEGLLEAFQQKYFEARLQIRQFEVELVEMQKKGATPHQMDELRLKMDALANREKAWIKSLMKTLDIYKATYKKENHKPKKNR